MTVGNTHAVLEFFCASPSAHVHAVDELVRGLGLSATEEGICHALPIMQAESAVAGVKFLNSILPGEVVR